MSGVGGRSALTSGRARTSARPDEDRVAPTLRDVLEAAGIGGEHLAICPPDPERIAVTGVGIYDRLRTACIHAGELVLGVGVDCETSEAARLVEDAVANGASAVFLSSVGSVAEAVNKASGTHTAIVSVPSLVPWGELFMTLLQAIAADDGGVPATQAGPDDLFALADTLCVELGGSVTIEDPQGSLLAYSVLDQPIDETRLEVILRRRLSDTWISRIRSSGRQHEKWASGHPLPFTAPGLRPRLTVAVKLGSVVLGEISVCEGHNPFPPDAVTILDRAASVCAARLVRRRARDDLDGLRDADLVLGVLEGRRQPVTLARHLGIDADDPITVVGFQLQCRPGIGWKVGLQGLQAMVASAAELRPARGATAAADDAVYTVLPGAEPLSALHSFAIKMITQAGRLYGLQAIAGIGSTVYGVHLASRSRREADLVLGVLVGKPGAAVADIEEMRPSIVLQELVALCAELPELQSASMHALANYDVEHGTQLVPTLATHLEMFGDTTRAAASLRIHVNTFRYRIRRIGAITGLDLANSDHRLFAQLQLRLFKERFGQPGPIAAR